MQRVRQIRLVACFLGLFCSAALVQAQQTKLLPSDTEAIVTFNLQQILKSDVAQKNKTIVDLAKAKINMGLEDKGLDKWLKKADFDLYRDLSSITIGASSERDPGEFFLILEGTFDAEKIEAAAAEASKDSGVGLKVIKIANVKAFEVTQKEEKPMYVGILNKKTMIACSTKAEFTESVARLNGGKATFKADVMKGLMETVNNKQSFSMVATSGVLGKLADKAPKGAGGEQAKKAAAILNSLDGLSLAITIAKDIDFQVGVNTKDANKAKEYENLSNVAITALRLQLEEKAKEDEKSKLGFDILRTIKATTQGTNLVIRGQITTETLEKILQNLPIPNN